MATGHDAPKRPRLDSVPRIAVAAVALLALAGAVLALGLGRPAPPVAAIEVAAAPAATATSPAVLVVDVSGAVARPGVVRLAPGARVLDALLAAGGMTAEADLGALNKAAHLRDGDRVHVPRPGEIPPPSGAGAPREERIDLNRASVRELDELPGVGPGTAQKIVRAREQRPFTKPEELQTRGIVTARVFAELRELVVVR